MGFLTVGESSTLVSNLGSHKSKSYHLRLGRLQLVGIRLCLQSLQVECVSSQECDPELGEYCY